MIPLRRYNLLQKLLMVAIILVAFALRVYNLEHIPNGLFADEFGSISGVYLAYYTRYSPQQRQADGVLAEQVALMEIDVR